MKMKVEGKRGKRKLKKGWLNTIENYMKAVDMYVGDIKNPDKWRFKTKIADAK
jgi:hypothetical protein